MDCRAEVEGLRLSRVLGSPGPGRVLVPENPACIHVISQDVQQDLVSDGFRFRLVGEGSWVQDPESIYG